MSLDELTFLELSYFFHTGQKSVSLNDNTVLCISHEVCKGGTDPRKEKVGGLRFRV